MSFKFGFEGLQRWRVFDVVREAVPCSGEGTVADDDDDDGGKIVNWTNIGDWNFLSDWNLDSFYVLHFDALPH